MDLNVMGITYKQAFKNVLVLYCFEFAFFPHFSASLLFEACFHTFVGLRSEDRRQYIQNKK